MRAQFLLPLLSSSVAAAQVELWSTEGATASAHLGHALAVVDDLDGDGWRDLAVGAPRDATGGFKAGAVHLFSGRTGAVIRSFHGSAANETLGTAVAEAGDLDGDGVGDVAIGAPGNPSGSHDRLRVVSGATGLVLWGRTDSALGWSAYAAGDLVGGSEPDLLAGRPFLDDALLLDGFDGSTVRTHGGGQQSMGWALLGGSAGPGDLNADGTADYLVGELGTGQSLSGGLWAFSGADGSTLWHHVYNDPLTCAEFGFALATLDDQDGDGVLDVLVGARDHESTFCGGFGFAEVRSGATSDLILAIASRGRGFGQSVAALHDLDGDGLRDYAVGYGPLELWNITAATVHVVSSATGLDLTTIEGVPGTQFGRVLATGDLNGDGIVEIAVGAPTFDGALGTDTGRVTLFSWCPGARVYCSAKANSLGCTPVIEGVGQASGSLPHAFRIKARQVLSHKAGILIYGFAEASIPFQGGTLCIQPPLRRTPVQSAGGGPPPTDCSGVYSLDFNDRIRSGVDPALVSGVAVAAQYWSRDSGAAFGTGLSDALLFTICL